MRKGPFRQYFELFLYSSSILALGSRILEIIQGEPCGQIKFITLIILFVCIIIFLIDSIRQLLNPKK